MKVGTLGHAVLGLLTAGPLTGYDLTTTFDRSLANVWSASHSQIYPELAKLQSAGLIELTGTGPRGSKLYTTTEAGKCALHRWLGGEVPHETLRSEHMLRVFFLWMVEPADAVAYLRREADRHRDALTRYERAIPYVPLDGHPSERWARIVLEAGLRFDRAMAEWADWAAGEIERDER